MRLAVVDVGASSIHVLITDSAGAVPLPARAWKARTRLAELLEPDGSISAAGRRRVVSAVKGAVRELRSAEADVVFPYATAVVRDAPNCEQVRQEVADATGVRLGLLSGVEDAQLTFLAARRWLGWQAGPMLVADIGGGSLEVAVGPDRLPDIALSLPMGARRLTREFLQDGDPPAPRTVRALRKHVREQIDQVATGVSWLSPRTAVATSRTFQQLARLTGAPPLRHGPFVTRELRRRELRPWVARLAALPVRHRVRLPGVSEHRARQILAGAIVAYELMRRLDVERMQICPWALREGILLRRLEAEQPALGNAGWLPCPKLPERAAA